MKVLLASDGFVTDDVLRTAMSAAAPEAQLAAIASTWPVPPYGDVGEVREAAGDEDELVAALRGCDVAFSHTFPFTRKVIEACPDLKMIAICRGGPVNVNIEAASDHGVLVSYAPGRNAVATAEHSVGMILAAMRQIPQRNAELLAGQWRSDYYIFDNVGPEVGSSTVGVIGYGAVGRRVAHVMASFGGDVLVHDPWAADRSGEGVAFVDTLEELLSLVDVVSLHVDGRPENTGFFGEDEFAAMRPRSFFLNLSRGSVFDHRALADALRSGHLAGAAVDVHPTEPRRAGEAREASTAGAGSRSTSATGPASSGVPP